MTPCRITAFPKVLTIDTQKENLPAFTIRKAQEYKIDVIPFSFFALRKIKRYCPDIKIEVKDKGTIIFYALLPTIGAIVFSLLS